MFGELPKLFDRDFAIAYFLPSAAFVAVTYILAFRFDFPTTLFTLSAGSFLTELATFGLLSLLGGIILLVANRGIVRMMEGYWPFGLGNLLNWFELKRFRMHRKNKEQSDEVKNTYANKNESLPRKLQDERNKIILKEANRFPNEEHLILPTSFGNTFRAFEVYSRVMYGINAIPGWYRLLAVIPKEFLTLINSARSRVDYWVNLWFLSLLVIIEYYLMAIWAKRVSWSVLFSRSGAFPWIPLIAFLFFCSSYIFARKSVEEWGNWVKSSFDLFLPELRTKLEFSPAPSKEVERQMWIDFNKSILSRDSKLMPDKCRKAPEPPITLEKLCIDLRNLNDQERLVFLDTAFRIAFEEPPERPTPTETPKQSG